MDTQVQRDRMMFLQGQTFEAAETLKRMQKEFDESKDNNGVKLDPKTLSTNILKKDAGG